MRICVCGAQVPFMHGGAELLVEALAAELREAGHEVDVLRIFTTFDAGRIFDAALTWRLVPVDADLVIATNFPSYFVRHDRKVVWLLHQHRAAYEASEDGGFRIDDRSLDDQRLLAQWDTEVLSEAVHRFTLSRVVSDRLARANGLTSEPLYHPPPLTQRLHPGPFGDYVFSALRLEGNKRPELLVDAMACATEPVKLILAGRGAMEHRLRDRVHRLGLDDRVHLVGYVDDDELIELFAGARAVVYAPFDEDYGYVTLQAFESGKPVIAAHDSGGVLEWVDDEVTGLVADATPAGIGAAIDRLAADPSLAERLGAAGRQRVANLSWKPVVEALTSC